MGAIELPAGLLIGIECGATRLRPKEHVSDSGELTGNPPSFNASEIHLDIPHLPYFLNLSTARLIRPDINAGPAETILPDVFAPLTADALATGTDPALDFVRTR